MMGRPFVVWQTEGLTEKVGARCFFVFYTTKALQNQKKTPIFVSATDITEAEINTHT